MGLYSELQRRNVFRVGAAYLVGSWLLLQVTDVLAQMLGLPEVVGKIVFLLLVIGLVPALVFSWAYELTPDGLKRESEIDAGRSISHETAARLDKITLVMLVLVIVIVVTDRLIPETVAPAPPDTATTQGGTASPAASPSIAVLPFADLSPDGDQQHFSDGITEELLNLLVRVDELKVASRTSAFSYKGSTQTLGEIAAELSVAYILEGSVRKDDRQVRITAQLVDADTDRHLWSETFDRELNSIFAIQDEIANSIVTALQSELGLLQDATPITVTADTENLDAYELYLEGRGLFLSRKDVGRSIELLEQAVALDPQFVRAWETLGAAYSVAEGWSVPGEDHLEKARRAAENALELDSNRSIALSTLSEVSRIADHDLIQAVDYSNRAVAVGPKNATAWFWRGLVYAQLGFIDEARANIEQCIELDPAYWNCYRHLSRIHLIAGREEQALATYLVSLRQGISINDFWIVPLLLKHGKEHAAAYALLHEGGGNPEYPGAELLHALENPDQDHAATVAKMDAWLGGDKLKSRYRGSEWRALGAYDRIEVTVDSYRIWLPSYADFRKTPNFKRLVNELNLLPYWQAKGFPPQCRPAGSNDYECD